MSKLTRQSYFPKSDLCQIRISLLFSQKKPIDKTWKKCFSYLSDHIFYNGIFLNNLIEIYNNDKEAKSAFNLFKASGELDNIEKIKTWLKMALYFNQEEYILDYLSLIPPKAYRSRSVRELIGAIFYRLGDKERAENFVIDVKTSNAENILGNQNLVKNNFELALGHFLIAIKKNPLSMNALKRIIPLSYILEKYELGLQQTKNFLKIKNQSNIIIVAFLNKLKQYQEAYRNISKELNLLKRNPDLINYLLAIPITINLNKISEASKYTKAACKQGNLMGCELYQASYYWGNLMDAKKEKENIKASIINYKDFIFPKDNNPIDEDVIINQKEIEKIDDQVRFNKGFKTSSF